MPGGEAAVPDTGPFPANPSGRECFSPEPSLTDEQQRRMERNKQLALERRQAKLLSDSQALGNGKLGFQTRPKCL